MQHGDDECFLNTIQACAITIYPDEVGFLESNFPTVVFWSYSESILSFNTIVNVYFNSFTSFFFFEKNSFTS